MRTGGPPAGAGVGASGGGGARDGAPLEYLCKWSGLSYAECSWEEAGGPVTSERLAAYAALSDVAAAARAEEERRRQQGWLTIAARVEVMPGEGLYAGAWCAARTISLPHAGMVAVEYEHLHAVPGDEATPKLRQKVELTRVRPPPPSDSPRPGGAGGATSARKPAASGAAGAASSSSPPAEARALVKAWGGDKGRPAVGDAVQMYYGQAWWRASVRAVRLPGELLDDLRDAAKLAADTKLLLQPVEDPNERKRRVGERRVGRDGRTYELCELRAASAAAGGAPAAMAGEAEGGALAEGGTFAEEPSLMDDLQLGSIAAVREWRLVPTAAPVPPAGDGDEPAMTAAGADDAPGASAEAAEVDGEAAEVDGEAAEEAAAEVAAAEEAAAEEAAAEESGAAPSRRKRPRRSTGGGGGKARAKAARRQRAKEPREDERGRTDDAQLRGVRREELPGARIVVTYNEEQQPLREGDARPQGGKELVGCYIEVYWEGDAIWYRAQVLKHHPMKGGGAKYCGTRESHSIYYPEDNVTEVVELHKETWRHIATTVKTSYRGTVIRSSREEGLQVYCCPL